MKGTPLCQNTVPDTYGETGLKRLCIAGGVGLNSVANSRILRETDFEELYIQPAAGDGGGALGAALWAYNSLLGKPRTFVMDQAYWGQSYSPAETSAFLREKSISYTLVENEDKLLDQVVQRLIEGKVIGWFQGRFEWGPRALGSRSILADARNPAMKDIVNAKIKFREPYRPFAPSVLAECAETYFDLPNATRHYPARYMLYVVRVREQHHATLPAITHVDGTGRLQTVFKEQSPLYYGLIERFRQATGVPVLAEHFIELEGRTHRQHSCQRLPYILQKRDGHPRPRELFHRKAMTPICLTLITSAPRRPTSSSESVGGRCARSASARNAEKPSACCWEYRVTPWPSSVLLASDQIFKRRKT